jgi:hypothetical protein
MDRRKPQPPLSDLLRRAIVDSGVSLNALAQATGVTRASIIRFVRGTGRPAGGLSVYLLAEEAFEARYPRNQQEVEVRTEACPY